MRFPFTTSNVTKVVAVPVDNTVKDETQEFSEKTISELMTIERYLQKGVHGHHKHIEPTEYTREKEESQRKLIIVQKILREKLAEQEAAKKQTEREYMVNEVPKHLSEIRISVNPSQNLNALPYGVTIDTLKFQKTDSPLINFKAPVKSNLNGKVITKVESFTFSLFDIPADRFTQMINNPFKPEMFRVGTQTLLVMVT